MDPTILNTYLLEIKEIQHFFELLLPFGIGVFFFGGLLELFLPKLENLDNDFENLGIVYNYMESQAGKKLTLNQSDDILNKLVPEADTDQNPRRAPQFDDSKTEQLKKPGQISLSSEVHFTQREVQAANIDDTREKNNESSTSTQDIEKNEIIANTKHETQIELLGGDGIHLIQSSYVTNKRILNDDDNYSKVKEIHKHYHNSLKSDVWRTRNDFLQIGLFSLCLLIFCCANNLSIYPSLKILLMNLIHAASVLSIMLYLRRMSLKDDNALKKEIYQHDFVRDQVHLWFFKITYFFAWFGLFVAIHYFIGTDVSHFQINETYLCSTVLFNLLIPFVLLIYRNKKNKKLSMSYDQKDIIFTFKKLVDECKRYDAIIDNVQLQIETKRTMENMRDC